MPINVEREVCGKTMTKKRDEKFLGGTSQSPLIPRAFLLLLNFNLDFDKLNPRESEYGAFRYVDVPKALQAVVDVHVALGDPVISTDEDGSKFALFGVSLDTGKTGDLILALHVLKTRDGKGAKNVRNCHPFGYGDGDDSADSARLNFPEFIAFMNSKGSDIFIFLLLLFCLIFIFIR